MATEYKLSYTGSEINEKLGKIDILAERSELPTKTSDLINDKGFLTAVPSEYITETELNSKGYLTEHQDISGKLDKSELPTAINTALAQAKASGEFKGEKGDKGDSIKGDTGATGKTAYQYAQDGGYTGTETEFAAKLAGGASALQTFIDNTDAL